MIKKIIYLMCLMVPLFLFSCNAPKTLYLKNTTDNTITLQVAADARFQITSMEATFIDSLNGRQLKKGYLIIGFGEGKWRKTDKESLRNILRKTTVVKSEGRHILPDDIRVAHYGGFVNELVVKIRDPK